MLGVFIRSMGLHLKWFGQSFVQSSSGLAPLNGRRLVFLFFAYPAFVAAQLLHWLGHLLDEICFPGYRKVEVKAPVFITGIPRSGTTFVHRTLAADDQQFTTVSTWEAILAPSITERKLVLTFTTIDRWFGHPIKRLSRVVTRRLSGDFDDIHEVNLSAAEEDYLWLLPAGGCFIMLLAFPFSPWLKQLGMFDRMEASARNGLLRTYHRCIQKHLYNKKGNPRFLSKNAAFGSWAGDLLQKYPDAKFIICVRDPLSALSSQLSSLQGARAIFGTDPHGTHTPALFREIFAHNYLGLGQFLETCPPQTAVCLNQSELRAASAELLAASLRHLDIERTPALAAELDKLKTPTTSKHCHQAADFGFEKTEIEDCMGPAFGVILNSGHRIKPRSTGHS